MRVRYALKIVYAAASTADPKREPQAIANFFSAETPSLYFNGNATMSKKTYKTIAQVNGTVSIDSWSLARSNQPGLAQDYDRLRTRSSILDSQSSALSVTGQLDTEHRRGYQMAAQRKEIKKKDIPPEASERRARMSPRNISKQAILIPETIEGARKIPSCCYRS